MRSFFSFLLFLSPLSLAAQPAITGRVVGGKKSAPLAYATVTCLDRKSKPLKATVTGTDGRFVLRPDREDDYRIVATMVGYGADTVRVRLGADPIDVGDLRLEEGVEIDAVAVTGKTLFEQQIDRYVYNVGSDPEAKKIRMSEMMAKVPMLHRKPDGKISYRGSDKPVQILIDGQVNELINSSKEYVMNFIRADVMERIEVIPPGSPEYDNDRPIINIKTARAIPNGYALDLQVEGNTENSWAPSADFVTKIRGKTVISLGYELQYADGPDLHGFSQRETFGDDARVTDVQQNATVNGSDNIRHALRFAGSTEVAGNPLRLSVNTSFGESNSRSRSDLTRIDGEGVPFGTQTTLSRSKNRTRPRVNFGTDYAHSIAGAGRMSYSYSYRDERAESETRSRTTCSGDTPEAGSRSLGETGSMEHAARVGFRNHTPGKGSVFGKHVVFANVQYVHRNYENITQYDRWDALSGDYIPQYDYAPGLEYVQRVGSVHVGYSYMTRRVAWQIRLNTDYEHSRGIFRQAEPTTIRYERLNPAPMASVKYYSKTRFSILGGYNMKIVRPDFPMLNPYVDISDPMNLRTGNPELDPERSHNFRLSLGWSSKSRWHIGLDMLYTTIGNAVERITTVDPATGVSTTTYDNVGRRNGLNARFECYTPRLFGRVSLTNLVTYDYLRFTTGGSDRIRRSTHGFSYFGSITITPWKSAELWGTYILRSDVGSPQNARVRYTHSFRFSLMQTLVKNRAYLSVAIRDPFDSHRYVGRSLEGANFRSFTRTERRGRIVEFSLRVNFGRFRDRVAEQEALIDDHSRVSLPDSQK